MSRYFALLLPLLLVACGDTAATTATAPMSAQERRTRDVIADMRKISEIVATVTDKTTAEASIPAISDVNKDMLALKAAQDQDHFVPNEQDPTFQHLALELNAAANENEQILAALRAKSPEAYAILEAAIKKMNPDAHAPDAYPK